jgi:hypothetical protein
MLLTDVQRAAPGGYAERVDAAGWTDAALSQLAEYGLLLESDPQLPCLTAIVAGGPIRGSWWGNPAARGTYDVLLALEDHPDALRTKLVNGKVTYVHRTLWPALLGVALAGEPWQSRALAPAAQWLLEEVRANAELRLDLVAPPPEVKRKALLEAGRDLERRLLVYGGQMHTESGAHTRVLETWAQWREVPEHQVTPLLAEEGRSVLDARMARLNDIHDANARLPWHASTVPVER